MLNLMKSEQYRFVRNRSYYVTGLLYILLMTGAAVTLYAFNQTEPNFPYGNERFLYLNVLGIMPVVFVLLFIFPIILMGDNKNLLKNSVAYGYSRQTIYTAKLLIILAGFLIFAIVLVGLSVLLGTTLMAHNHENALTEYARALVKLLPIMITGLTSYYCLAAIMKNTTQLVIAFLLIYFLPHFVLGYLQGRFTWAAWMYSHGPAYYLINTYGDTAYAAWEPWVVGAVFTMFFYRLGLYLFKKEEF